jgi:signal transduction histidine kinase
MDAQQSTAQHTSSGAATTASATTPTPAATVPMANQILIVDDVPENLQVLGSMLQRKGYDVNVASSGMDALALIAKQKPDLILLDVAMPQMDGFQVCEKLKSEDDTRDIPIMFLTAHSDKERIVRGFQVGGVDYITKPFHAAELLARVRTHLELKTSKELVLRRNDELQVLNDDKNELFGIVAHDLKNPLNGIKGIAEVLLKDVTLTGEQIREFYENIFESSQKMFALIENLLNVNAIERGAIQMTIQPTAVAGMVAHLVNQYRSRAEAKNITLHLSNDELAVAECDELSLVQILDNLISNAVKYSPLGKNVYVRVTRSSSETGADSQAANNQTTTEARSFIRFEVQDEGPGLTDDDKSKLFGKFAKLSAQPTGKEHSTGLGLSIVKKLVESMNGRVWCESEAGKGATFIVELPQSSETLD